MAMLPVNNKQTTAIMFDPAQEREAARKRQLAEILVKRGNTKLENETAGGMTVARSPWENINQGAQKYMGEYQLMQADEQAADVEKKRGQLMSEALGQMDGDMMGAAQMLMQDPNSREAGMRMYGDALNRDRQEAMMRENWDRQAQMQNAGFANQERLLNARLAQQGQMDAIKRQQEPLPVGAIKLQGEYMDSFDAAKNVTGLSDKLIKEVESGQLSLGAGKNVKNEILNYFGSSNPESVSYAQMNTDLEKLRNDTLRLNKGVQTEGDAQRAMNEVISSKNDPKVFAASMKRLNEINNRAMQFQQQKINDLRANYGKDQYDFGNVPMQPQQDPRIQQLKSAGYNDAQIQQFLSMSGQ